MNALNPSHTALIAEVTALRASLGDAVELCETLRSERDALRAAVHVEQEECDTIASNLVADDYVTRAVEEQAQLLSGVAGRLRAALERSAP